MKQRIVSFLLRILVVVGCSVAFLQGCALLEGSVSFLQALLICPMAALGAWRAYDLEIRLARVRRRKQLAVRVLRTKKDSIQVA